MTTKYYWYKQCPICEGQGRLLILRDVTHDRLYLHCDECEWGWLDPELVDDVSAAFLTLDEEFNSEAPTLEEIQRYGWERYALHSFEE
ncbi:MAG TPA: hypothetical protein VN999_12160 [Thermoanaerobaculia bacterium]|nr:hypothetical protein [Thermoanaerobaculia bacterium]